MLCLDLDTRFISALLRIPAARNGNANLDFSVCEDWRTNGESCDRFCFGSIAATVPLLIRGDVVFVSGDSFAQVDGLRRGAEIKRALEKFSMPSRIAFDLSALSHYLFHFASARLTPFGSQSIAVESPD